MNKLSYGLLLSLFFTFTSVSAEVSPESIVNIFQRLEILEKKARELHGDNEVLRHELDKLKKTQKDGFLNVDERIEALSKSNEKTAITKTNTEEKVKIVDYAEGKTKPDAVTTEKVEKPKSTEPKKVEAKVPEKAKPKEGAAAEKKQEETTASSKSKKTRAPTAYEKETYKVAFNLMKTSPSAATKAFKEYIMMQPKSPLAANSQYWIAEIMYSHNNYKGAVKEFIKVLQEYKYSDKAPDAAIKLGYSFYALKNWAYARRTFNDVLKYFPDNKNAVNLAKKRLEKMTAAGH